MSDLDISRMTDKQLRNEVQALRDELAVFKRRYEDMIYNLDSDNFGKSFTIEQDNMRAQVKMTADAIKTMVSNDAMMSAITQKADSIKIELSDETDEKLTKYATREYTTEAITDNITKEYIEAKIEGVYVESAKFSTMFETSATGLRAEIKADYEGLEGEVSALSDSITTISATAEEINTKVTNLETSSFTEFTQTSDYFLLDGDKVVFTGHIFLTDNAGTPKFALGDDESQGFGQVTFRSVTETEIPLVLGDSDGAVYVGTKATGNEVATRSWVNANPNIVAVFG